MSQFCSDPSDDTHLADFYCECGIVLCEQHIPQHITDNPGHALSVLWEYLSPQEISNLQKSISFLDECLLIKSNLLDIDFYSKEGSFLRSIQRAKDLHAQETENFVDKQVQICLLYTSPSPRDS